MNGYVVERFDGATIEAWAGGPCILTGQRCPVWSVKRADGTGIQTRGRSRAGSIEEVAADALRVAREHVVPHR